MKSKFFRILGVVTSVAMLASVLAVVPAMALSVPQVTLATGSDVISKANANYTITFTTGTALTAAASDTITLTFPADTTIAASASITATIVASPGWVTNPVPPPPQNWTNAQVTTPGIVSDPTARTIKFTLDDLGDVIGASASVIINITTGITNPTTAGSYQVSVKTSQETTAVPSASYTIVVPTLAFPGIVKIYNPAGIQMDQKSGATPITDALGVAGPGYTLEIGPGTYAEPLLPTLTDVAGEFDGLIIKASGALADTVISANWHVDADSVTFKGLTLKNGAGTTAVLVDTIADKVIFDGCAFVKKNTATTAVAENFILYGNVSASGTGTITGCTFDSSLGAVTDMPIINCGVGLTVKNCTFTLDNTEPINPGYATILTVDDIAITAPVTATITGNTFTGTTGGYAIKVYPATATATVTLAVANGGGAATVTSGGAGYTSAPAVTIGAPPAGGTQATATATVVNGSVATITVVAGAGYLVAPTVTIAAPGGATGKSTITSNTFKTLDVALYANGTPTVVFDGNTVDTCGMPMVTTYNAGGTPTIFVSGVTSFLATNNTIKASKAGIAWVADACAAVTHFNFNNFSGNTFGVVNSTELAGGTPGNKADATHNFWGAATGPTAYQNLFAKGCDTSGYLGAAATNGTVVLGGSAVGAKSTASVDVASFDANGLAKVVGSIGVASYSAVPVVAVPSTLKAVKFYDVFAQGATVASFMEIKFYGTITAGASAEVWFYNLDTGAWTKCSNQTAVSGGGYVMVTVTGSTAPAIVDLLGTPFVLAEAPPTAPVAEVVKQAPVLGAVNIPVDTTFTWPAVSGAVSYIFELAEETGQTDKFYLKDEVGGPTVNAYKLVDDLKYDTQYWWRVQAINSANVKSAWTTSFFTTAKEVVVVEPTPPVVIQENPPAQITLEIPPDEEVVVEPIPAYLLWAVIAVGALLVIVVIVLIVRTRRIS